MERAAFAMLPGASQWRPIGAPLPRRRRQDHYSPSFGCFGRYLSISRGSSSSSSQSVPSLPKIAPQSHHRQQRQAEPFAKARHHDASPPAVSALTSSIRRVKGRPC